MTNTATTNASKTMTDTELATAARRYDATINEGGEGFNPHRDEQDRRAQAAVAVEAAEWTLETTQARRVEWNARVQSGQFGATVRNKGNNRDLATQEREQGWSMADLKREIKRHGL